MRFVPKLSAALLLLVVGLAAQPARAYDFLVPGSRGPALGGAMAATTDDAFAVWHNPALLARSDSYRFGLSYALIDPQLNVSVNQYGSLGFVPSLQAYDSTGQLGQEATRNRISDSFGLASPDMVHGFNLHMLFPIHRMIPKLPFRAGLGATLFIPCGGTCVVKVKGHTPDQPFFPVFGSRNQRLRLMVGLGIEIIKDWWTLGISGSFFTSMKGVVSSYTPVATYDPDNPDANQPAASTATFDQELGTTVTPVLGTAITPIPELAIGLFYRFAERLDLEFTVDAGVSFDLGYPIEAQMPYFLETDFFFVPATLGLAVSGTLFDSLSITAQLDYVFWSDVTDNININQFDLKDGAINDKGGLITMEEYGDFRVRSLPPPKIRARNIFVPRVGLEYTLNKYVQFRGGYSYTPSALEADQKYHNMLLDNTYHTIGLGVGFRYYDPLDLLDLPILIDLHGQMLVLEPRYNKIGVADEVGGYHAKGVVETSGFYWGIGINVTFQL